MVERRRRARFRFFRSDTPFSFEIFEYSQCYEQLRKDNPLYRRGQDYDFSYDRLGQVDGDHGGFSPPQLDRQSCPGVAVPV